MALGGQKRAKKSLPGSGADNLKKRTQLELYGLHRLKNPWKDFQRQPFVMSTGSGIGKLADERLNSGLGIAEEHARVRLEEERILDACKSGPHRAFEHNDRP